MSAYVFINMSRFKWKAEAQAIFLNQFTVCSLCQQKFVICPFVDDETNGLYPFANRLNELYGLNGLLYIIFILLYICVYK